MRNHLSLLFLMAPLPALAHVGHLDVVEGHDHYIAAWALLAAIAGSLWLIRAEIKAPRKPKAKRPKDGGAGA
jgi:hypothetical protein